MILQTDNRPALQILKPADVRMNDIAFLFEMQKENMLFSFLDKTRYIVHADTRGFEKLQAWC